jgi:hypothetical protein
LNSTVFSQEEIGTEAFVEMIAFGAQRACLEYADGASLPQIIREALGESPVAGIPVDDWTPEQTTAAFSTALHIISQGVPLYCPSLPPILSLDNSEAAEDFTDAWQEFISG